MAVTFTLGVVGTPGGAFGTKSATEQVTDQEGEDILVWAAYEAARIEGAPTSDAQTITDAMAEVMTAYLKQQAARHKAKFG